MKRIIHTSSGSQLNYERLAKERPMHDRDDEKMPLPKALNPDPNATIKENMHFHLRQWCIDAAIKSCDDTSSDEVIKTATTFYNFVKG